MKNRIFIAVALLGLSTLIASCTAGEGAPTTPSQTSSSGAQTVNVATQFRIPTNANGNTIKQQQIMDRYRVTSDPTKILWMHLVDLNGRIYLRTPVRGKVTSSTKRLEPVSATAVIFIDEHNDDEIVATVNLPDVQLGTDEVIIKDYSENTGMYEAMLKRGYISPEIRRVESGFIDVPVVKLLIQPANDNQYANR